jgi:GAF domain-containing protein
MGTVAQRREGLLVNDYRARPFAHPVTLAQSPITAGLSEPLLCGDRLLGVLGVNHVVAGRTFSTGDQATLKLFAAQAAIAVENARLFDEQQRAFASLQRAQDELVAAAKLRALGQMAAGIAHDLNNMLAAILGQVELVKLRGGTPEIREGLETLQTAATDGADVVRRLQDFARQRVASPPGSRGPRHSRPGDPGDHPPPLEGRGAAPRAMDGRVSRRKASVGSRIGRLKTCAGEVGRRRSS